MPSIANATTETEKHEEIASGPASDRLTREGNVSPSGDTPSGEFLDDLAEPVNMRVPKGGKRPLNDLISDWKQLSHVGKYDSKINIEFELKPTRNKRKSKKVAEANSGCLYIFSFSERTFL
jgi:hypothetical protein